MRIGIDARPLTVQNFTGIPNYVYQICKQWMENHPEHEYYLMSRRPICFTKEELPDNWHIVDEPWIIDKGKFWFLFKLPALIKQYELDVFWGPNYSLPRKVKGTKYYLSIMDMAIFKFRHVGQFKNTMQIKLFLKSNIKKAERIIAISESTKRDVAEIMNVNPERIVVTYIAGDSRKSTCDGMVRTEIAELDNFFLFVGTIEPRKNIKTIIDGFEKYCERTKDFHTKLVLAGGKGWNCSDIYTKAQRSIFSDRIIMPGYITDAEKKLLYKKAIAFIYPSLYEGFGMPILEAFYYGTPVITANNSSLPEVGGTAAFYIETLDCGQLAKKMIEVKDIDKEMIQQKMKCQIKNFSWEKCANQTLGILTEVNKKVDGENNSDC